MNSALPKVLHQVAGKALVNYPVATATILGATQIITVVDDKSLAVQEQILAENGSVTFALQKNKLGTAHAVSAALPLIENAAEVVILYGDTPGISLSTLRGMLEKLRASERVALVTLGFHAEKPGEYGRMLVNEAGFLSQIIEYYDATEEQRKIKLCNSGVMAIRYECLKMLLPLVHNNNARGEYYLTDLVQLARKHHLSCVFHEAQESEVMGVNNRAELAKCEYNIQQVLRKAAQDKGATLIAPETVTFSYDTVTGRDVVIHPYVVFGPQVVLEDNVIVKSFSAIAGAKVKKYAEIGPFARIRPGTVIDEHAHIGNFVEIKNSQIASEVKINHMSYIGDAIIGSKTNIGAGTITCNYDGVAKHQTTIGESVFVGSHTSLVAPVNVASYSFVGAGSVITKDVPEAALAVARSKQVNLLNKAKLKAVKSDE
jgi:bifunctional UDP-N-acetylglucosamine pyrophosphorylase/glucosamine-1-phosphate N-acetyltransferase